MKNKLSTGWNASEMPSGRLRITYDSQSTPIRSTVWHEVEKPLFNLLKKKPSSGYK